MTLAHDVPSSQGVKNGLKRAKRLVEASFTPVKRFPIVTNCNHADGSRTYVENYAPAWLPQKGMPYSSVRRVEKYIGYNVSFETFYSALANPDSVVYTRPITGTAQNVHNHYGIVCSCFVSEVLDLPYRTPCIRFPELPDVEEVAAEPLENLRLLDIVLNVKRHVAVITDIERDERGAVRFITVSESVLPNCRAVRFTPGEFRGYWFGNGFRIFRYGGTDRITYTPDPVLPLAEDGPLPEATINRALMTDYGNKANYRLGEQVRITVFDAGFDRVLVEAPNGTASLLPVSEGRCALQPERPGFYSVRAVRGEEKSDPVEFCVTDLLFTMDRESYKPGEAMTVSFRNSAGDPIVAWQFNECASDRGREGGFFTEPLPGRVIGLTCPDVEKRVELYLMARNAYGVYTSERVVVNG